MAQNEQVGGIAEGRTNEGVQQRLVPG
jgi:hypothetical protein